MSPGGRSSEGAPGAEVSADAPASRAPCRGDNAGAQGAGAESGRGSGQILGLCLGQAPRSFPGELGRAAAPALFRGPAGALGDPSCPPSSRHGQERERRRLIAITYKENHFWGRPLPPPLSSAK